MAAETQSNIDTHMAQMMPEDQQRARDYLKAPKAGHFWYSAEFAGPTVILKRHTIPEVLDLYRLLSMAAHAGFLGLGCFETILTYWM